MASQPRGGWFLFAHAGATILLTCMCAVSSFQETHHTPGRTIHFFWREREKPCTLVSI